MGHFKKRELIFFRKSDENKLGIICKAYGDEKSPTYIVSYEMESGELDWDLVTDENIIGSIQFSDKLAGLGRFMAPTQKGGLELEVPVKKVL